MSARRTLPVLALRYIFAALSLLALLSAAVPVGVLSATAHSCAMPCCASGTGCETGACTGALFKTPQQEPPEEELCGAEQRGGQESHEALHESGHAPSQEVSHPTTSDHCDSETEAVRPSAPATSKKVKSPEVSLTARSFVAPCPKDCCAAATSSTQSRRWRDSVLNHAAYAARDCDLISFSKYTQNLPPPGRNHLRQLRPRAPPSLPAYVSS